MWIICCGMFRSGSTVQYQITSALVEALNIGKGLGFTSDHRFSILKQDEWFDSGSYVLKAHKYIPDIGALVASGKARGIYSYRDIRDVVLSWMRKSHQSLEQIIQSDFIPQLIEDYEAWTCLGDSMLVSRYETNIKNLRQEVKRIGTHLGLQVNNNLVSAVSSRFSLDRQKDYIGSFDYRGHGTKLDEQVSYDPVSLLHNNHIFSGETEQWKTVFSIDEIRQIEAKCSDWLTKHGYELAKPNMNRSGSWGGVQVQLPTDTPNSGAVEINVTPNERIIEIPWMLSKLPQHGLILDIGSADTTYLGSVHQGNRRLHSIDANDRSDEMPRGVVFHHQGLLGNSLPHAYYDAVVALSVIEHIGLPGNGQCSFENGDRLALGEIARLLKPGGYAIFTVPAGQSKMTLWYRQYSPRDLRLLFADWDIEISYWAHDGINYKSVSEADVLDADYDYSRGAGAIAGIIGRPRSRH